MKKIATIAGAGMAAVALSAGVVSTTAIAAPVHKADQQRPDRVTGAAAQSAIDAALAVVPGTTDHAHKTPDGGYVVRVLTADGKRIVVSLDAGFVVTGQQEASGRGGKRAVTDAERTQASAAALAAVPGGNVLDVFTAKDGTFGVIVRTDGVKKLVTLDSKFAVVSVQDAKRGKHRGHHRHGKGTEVTGDALAKAEAAALAAVPGGTVVDVHGKGAGYHVLVQKADGSKVHVTLAADFTVTATTSYTMKTRS